MPKRAPATWKSGQAARLRRLIDTSIESQAGQIRNMPEHYFAAVGVDKAGLLSCIEQASIALEAVHDVVADLPDDFGPGGGVGSTAIRGPREGGPVIVAEEYRGRYVHLFDSAQILQLLTVRLGGRNTRVRAREGVFRLRTTHLRPAG